MKAKMTVYQKGGKMPIVPDPKKKNVPDPKKNGTGLYFESKDGRVGRTYPLYGSAVEVQSMDTTGYGAGRQDFKLETSKPGSGKSSTPVKREDVLKTINKLKSGASRVAKFNNGGKMPIDPPKAELAKKLFGEMPKFDKNKFRKEMMGEKLNKLQKERDYWIKRGEPTAASGVKVQMDKIREDMKKYSKGGKMPMYGMGGKIKKYLKGGQVKLDKNKDGKISGADFKMMK